MNYSSGSSNIVQIGGFKNLIRFGKCEDERHLLKHCADWEEALTKYGGTLRQDPVTLRNMFISIIPKAMEEKMMKASKRVKFPTWQTIHKYIKQEFEGKRQHAISNALHQPPRQGRINSVGVEGKQEAQAEPQAPPVASLQQLAEMVFAMNQDPTARRTQKGAGKGAAKGAGKGAGKGEGKGAGFKKFIFRGCWECGVEGHSRHECPEWLRILDKDGSPPAGHKGKKQKALDSWKAKKNAKVNALGVKADEKHENDTEDDDDDEDDEDSEYEEPSRPHRMLSFNHVMQPVATQNTFEALDNHQQEYDSFPATMINDSRCLSMPNDFKFLNEFAHHIQTGKKLSQKKAKMPTKSVTVTSEKDLHKVKHFMNALPTDAESLNRMAKLCPTVSEEKLGEGEIWVMADTGSTLNGINVKKELPKFSKLVRCVDDDSPGAETACGGRVKINGEISLTGHIDNELHTIDFKDMNVTMPIASMIQTVKKGNNLIITEKGGKIVNRKTRKVVRLHEREGVYFFKMKLLPVHMQSRYAPTKSGFTRPA